MASPRYGFVRNISSFAWNPGAYQQAGLTGALFNAEDPNLEHALAKARASGMSAGIWLPASGADPVAYARRLAELSRYNPDIVVPNVEFTGKGYGPRKERPAGDPGWNWSERMMAEYRRLSPQQKIAVSVMGNQDDFNYKAYTGRGADVWAQAYAGDMTPMDADQVYQTLIKNGVDPARASITLAPGARGGRSAAISSAYTIDDMNPAQLRALGGELSRNTPGSAPNPPPPTHPLVEAPNVRPMNAAALMRARSQLKQLKKLGYTPQMFGLERAGVAGQIKEMSPIFDELKTARAQIARSRAKTPPPRVQPRGTTRGQSQRATKVARRIVKRR